MTDTTTTDRWTAHRIELSNGIFECDCGDASFPSTEAALDHLNAAAALVPELVEALRGLVDFVVPEALGLSNSEYIAALDALNTAFALLARLDQEANERG